MLTAEQRAKSRLEILIEASEDAAARLESEVEDQWLDLVLGGMK